MAEPLNHNQPRRTSVQETIVASQKRAAAIFFLFNMVDCNQQLSAPEFGFSQLLRIPAQIMGFNSPCTDNCSGHGECYEGRCFCEVQFSGGTCTDPNLSYFIAFSTIFYIICATSLIQLILCVKSEFSRMKSPSVLQACKVTTQKALYLLICIATAIRGFYFSSPENANLRWTSSLLSAYYPVLLTGSSLIVCFWAEVFHLRDLRFDTPHFLSKSFLGFVAFNIISYSLLLVELFLLGFGGNSDNEKSMLVLIFNSCYAVLMLIVVTFFLIYGVEVFFKVRGGFTSGPSAEPTNASQLHQSRFGLVSQAVLLLITAAFMLSDVMGSFWKDKVPVLSRNYHNVIFRVVELGVALWFPCVLWNCLRPEQLWILNPRKIFQKLEIDRQTQPGGSEAEALVSPNKAVIVRTEKPAKVDSDKLPECFICYDTDRQDAGALIQPCACKGDVSVVHHECLKKWLVESSDNPDNNRCKVCNEQYELERETMCFPRGISPTHWLKTGAIICVMSSSAAGACLVVKMFESVGLRTLAVGVALLVEYVCLRFLGFSVILGYQRAKFSAVKILSRKFNDGQNDSRDLVPSIMTVRLTGEHIETVLEHTPMFTHEEYYPTATHSALPLGIESQILQDGKEETDRRDAIVT